MLSLGHHPADDNATSASSKTLRRTASESFARAASTTIARLVDQAGSDDDADLPLEAIQALVILGSWEFGARGNMAMMRKNTGEALRLAMELGLHRSDASWRGESWMRDMRRRTWWMVFTGLMQSSIVSGTVRPTFLGGWAELPT